MVNVSDHFYAISSALHEVDRQDRFGYVGSALDRKLHDLIIVAPVGPFPERIISHLFKGFIGKLPDTALWAQRRYNVFQMDGQFYQVQEANSAWMTEVIENQQPIMVVSDLTDANLSGDTGLFEEGFSSFGSELGEALSAGYEFVTTEEAGEILLILLIP